MMRINSDAVFQYKIMSIYYNHSQNIPPKLHSNSRTPNQSHLKLQPIASPSKERLTFNQQKDSKSPKQRVKLSLMERKQQQQQWQDIGAIQKREQKQIPPKQQSMIGNQKQRKKSLARLGLRGTLATIVNYYEEQESVAEITHYQVFSDKEDQLSHSNSTIQSNDRNKCPPIPRKHEETLKNTQQVRQGRNLGRNTQFNPKDQMQNEQLAIRQKQSLEKSRPRYLFYKVIEEQREEPQKKNIKDSKPLLQKNSSSPQQSQNRQNPGRLISQKDYEYVKDVHVPNENKKNRLKNKLGFICDIFQRAEQAASVSYYSQSHNSNKESMEVKKKEPYSQNKIQGKNQDQNIFHPNQRQQQQYERIEQNQPRSIINIKEPSEQPSRKSNQLQQLNFKQPQQSPPKQDYRLDSSSLKIKKSIKVNKSLEKIQLQMAQINRNRSRSKLSATKSLQNKPKVPRYNDVDGDQIPNEENIPKKQSVDFRDLSRHIKKSINRQSSSKQTPGEQLMKSKSASSKFSIKLMEMQLQPSSQKQQKSISQGKAQTPKQNSHKKSKQQQIFEEETTVKKLFPIARKQSLHKNNGNFSKYMRINFKEDSQINQNDEKQQIPNIVIKKNDTIQRSKPILSIQRQPIKINSNTNTNEQTSKISFKPVNRVDFNIDRTKRINTEYIQPKDELSEQQKKFLALLKKRQEALLKRVKEQVINNNPTSILRDNFQQKSKATSNQTFEKILNRQQNSSNKPKNYYQAQRRQKMSLKSEHQNQVQMKPYFPTLNMSPTSKQQYQTFYNNNPLKRTSSKKANYILSSKKKGFSQQLSSDSQRGKTLQDRFQDVKNYKKQPSKISYYNIKKLHKEASLNQKNLNSKQKYERLKQLLQKI